MKNLRLMTYASLILATSVVARAGDYTPQQVFAIQQYEQSQADIQAEQRKIDSLTDQKDRATGWRNLYGWTGGLGSVGTGILGVAAIFEGGIGVPLAIGAGSFSASQLGLRQYQQHRVFTLGEQIDAENNKISALQAKASTDAAIIRQDLPQQASRILATQAN